MMKRTMLILLLIGAILAACNKAAQKARTAEQEIKVEDLPQAVKAYVLDNYRGYEMDEAEMDTDCNGNKLWEVELEKGTEEIELIFSESGDFLYTEKDMPSKDLPSAVRNKIIQNYGQFTMDKEASQLIDTAGKLRYEVSIEQTLNGQKVDREILIMPDGTVICDR